MGKYIEVPYHFLLLIILKFGEKIQKKAEHKIIKTNINCHKLQIKKITKHIWEGINYNIIEETFTELKEIYFTAVETFSTQIKCK